MTTSATGGYLNETETTLNIEHFFHDLIVGLTGIGAKLVRPRWQPNAPTMPLDSVDWCGFGVTTLESDDSAYVKEDDSGSFASLLRYETLSVLCSFYGANARDNARKMRDGLEIGQNREVLFLIGFSYITCTPTTHIPELLNDVWVDRYDIEFRFAHEVQKNYNVLSIQYASVYPVIDNGIDTKAITIVSSS